jgi:hypothetical protein
VKIEHDNGTTTEAIGFVELGGMVIPRVQLAKLLPEIARLERGLPLARYISGHDSAPHNKVTHR